MNISLSSEMQDLIRRKIESGNYASADEVIESALRLFESLDQELTERAEELKKGVQEGIRDMENGRSFLLNEQTQPELEERILQKSFERMEERRRKAM